MNTKMTKLALALGAMALAGGAWAEGATSTIGASASIAAACSVGSGTTIALGSLVMITGDGTATAVDTSETNTFPAICTNGTTFPKFAYSSENGGAAGVFKLKGVDTVKIDYTLYQAAVTTGTAVGATAAAHPDFLPNGVSQALSLAAKVAAADKAGKTVQAYSDVITITSSFGVN